jgi:hypothetical protein
LGIEFSLDLNRITEINFSKKIKKVSAILKSWLGQSKTSLQKRFFKLTEISLSFSFCRYKTLSPPYCLRSVNHENKKFYSFEQIQEKLETNNFLMFYRLIARIPKAFKDCLKENPLQKVHKCVSFNFILYKNEFVAIILCRNLN